MSECRFKRAHRSCTQIRYNNQERQANIDGNLKISVLDGYIGHLPSDMGR